MINIFNVRFFSNLLIAKNTILEESIILHSREICFHFFISLIAKTYSNTWRQFHQRFSRTFFVRMSVWQIFLGTYIRTHIEKSCQNDIRTKKSARKTLMKLTPGLSSIFNFLFDFKLIRFKLILSLGPVNPMSTDHFDKTKSDNLKTNMGLIGET